MSDRVTRNPELSDPERADHAAQCRAINAKGQELRLQLTPLADMVTELESMLAALDPASVGEKHAIIYELRISCVKAGHSVAGLHLVATIAELVGRQPGVL